MKIPPQPPETVRAAVAFLKARTQRLPTIGVVLGSGLGDFAQRIEAKTVVPYQDISGFPVPGVEGHAGRLVLGRLHGKDLAILQGRCHLYEGYTAAQVCFPIRVLAALGIGMLILTSAAGSLREDLAPGDFLLIRDHLNLMADNPLRGFKEPNRSPFVSMSSVYDKQFLALSSRLARTLDVHSRQGVLAAVLGPSYETPAEAAVLKTLGADAVCMSTVPEAIMARYLNLRVAGVALMTNWAGSEVDTTGHQRVLAAADVGGKVLSEFLERWVETV